MFMKKAIAFAACFVVLCLSATVFAQDAQPSAPTAPSVDQTASDTPADSDQTTTETPAANPTTSEAPVDSNQTAPAAPADSNQTAPAAPVSGAAQTPQPVQGNVAEQTPPEKESFGTLWSGWIAAGLLVVIVFWMIRNGRSAKKAPGNVDEEPEDDIPDIQGKKLPFIGNPELILNNERFAPGSELFTEAQKLASYRADCYLKALDKKLETNAKSEDPVDRNTLQSIANSLQPEFVDDLCKPGTVWMQKVFGANDVPEYLPLYIRSLFKPIQVPDGSKLKLEVPSVAVGILAALGAIIGAWIVGLFAWTGGMKQPGDITTLVGAAAGAGLFSWLIFWATANETVRKTLEYAVGTVAAVDAAATVASYFISFGSFFGAKKTIQGGFLKRLALYAACWFVLHLMKRPVVFDRQDYKNKLEALYFERIQSIVLFLASCSSISENDRKDLNEEQERWAKKVDDLEARLKANKQSNNYIGFMYPRVRSLWNLDIRQLEPQLRSLAQDFISLGMDLPKSERMHFAEQLDALIKKQNGTDVLPEKPAPVKQERRRFIWSDEYKEQFDRIGLIDPGEEVVVLDEPVFQNDKVIKKGNVQCSDDYSEL
ncbi:MAG: hypothetical protein IJQ39_06340 [Thermoguttaceae bacterium]|nr:hypothetical protein [Thermoguttaceae bacterium]